MKAFIKVMKALSDPNRVKILKLLQNKKLCVCELRCALEISQPICLVFENLMQVNSFF